MNVTWTFGKKFSFQNIIVMNAATRIPSSPILHIYYGTMVYSVLMKYFLDFSHNQLPHDWQNSGGNRESSLCVWLLRMYFAQYNTKGRLQLKIKYFLHFYHQLRTISFQCLLVEGCNTNVFQLNSIVFSFSRPSLLLTLNSSKNCPALGWLVGLLLLGFLLDT